MPSGQCDCMYVLIHGSYTGHRIAWITSISRKQVLQ
jgi:hypothetical protein